MTSRIQAVFAPDRCKHPPFRKTSKDKRIHYRLRDARKALCCCQSSLAGVRMNTTCAKSTNPSVHGCNNQCMAGFARFLKRREISRQQPSVVLRSAGHAPSVKVSAFVGRRAASKRTPKRFTSTLGPQPGRHPPVQHGKGKQQPPIVPIDGTIRLTMPPMKKDPTHRTGSDRYPFTRRLVIRSCETCLVP